MTVGIRELKAKLSEYLKRVQGGETIAITSRNKVIAEIQPAPRRRKGRKLTTKGAR